MSYHSYKMIAPKGIDSWMDTHFRISYEIGLTFRTARGRSPNFVFGYTFDKSGVDGLRELSRRLTNTFEHEHQTVAWDDPAMYVYTLTQFVYASNKPIDGKEDK